MLTHSDTLSWWSSLPYKIDPTFVTLFGKGFITLGSTPDGSGFPLRWYGIGYLLAFYTVWKVMSWTIKREKIAFDSEKLELLFTWSILGIIVGARLGYVLFYNPGYYIQHPLEIILPFKGGHFTGIAGMSFHGGLIGGVLASFWKAKNLKVSPYDYFNLAFFAVPLGYTWGRLGNFMNGELYGRATSHPIGMLFPADSSALLRHPSQLYEALGEGVLLFLLLFFLRSKVPAARQLMGPLFVGGYGVARFFIEFFREPDAHIGLGLLGLSRGQFLCIAMVLIALVWGCYSHQKNSSIAAQKK